MATPKQVALIEELLEELEWDADDIDEEIGEEYEDYADLGFEDASELISELIDRRREETAHDR